MGDILQIAHQKSKAILYFISQAIYKEGDKLNVEGLKRFSMQAGNLTLWKWKDCLLGSKLNSIVLFVDFGAKYSLM